MKKKLKKKKGFSLIELLGVIMILGILMIIAVPQVYRYIKKGKDNYYNSVEKEMSTAGANYLEDYRALLPKQVGHVSVIDLSELVTGKYIDTVKDEKGLECTGRVIAEKTKKDSYDYYSCLKCGDHYETKDANCEKNEGMNKYADSDEYSIVVDNGPYEATLGEKYNPPLGTVYHNGEPYLINGSPLRINGTPREIIPYELKEYTINYYYHGANASIKVEVKDGTAPSAVSVVLRRGNSSGKIYTKDWTNADLYAKYKATDYAIKGVKGSGIDYYEVSNDGITYTKLDANNEVLSEEGSYTRYVRAVDKSGKIGPVTEFKYNIDKTKPTCSWEGESTDWQPNLNLPAEQRVQSRTIVATCADTRDDGIATSGCTTKTASKTWERSDSEKTVYLSYKMSDNAGNTEVCEKIVDVYLDKTPPTISAKSSPLGLRNAGYNFLNGNINKSDAHSGIASASCNPATSRNGGSYNVTCSVTDNVGLSRSVTFSVRDHYTASCYTETNDCWKRSCSGPYKDGNNNDYYSCYCPCSDSYENYGDTNGTCGSTSERVCTCPYGGSLNDETCYY